MGAEAPVVSEEERDLSALIDLIYDAASDPDLWPTVMERTADAIGGTGAWLSQLNMLDGHGGGLITRIDPEKPAVYQEHFAQRNPLANVADPAAYLRSWTPRILTDEDWMPKEELLASEYYNDFLKPQDIHSTIMIRLAKQGEDIAALNINRTARQEQFGPRERAILEALHPHLIRAYRLTQKFAALEQHKAQFADVLDRSPFGLFMVDEHSRIRHVNRQGETLLASDCGLRVRHGVLTLSDPKEARMLAALIAAAASRTNAAAGSMTLHPPSRSAPIAVTTAPARATRYSEFGEGVRAVVFMSDAETTLGASERRLRETFGLTDAEARVALALFEGATPAEAAETFGVSVSTIRSQLAKVLQKTDSRRQSDLIRLLMRTMAVVLD